ncbi:MAG: HD domain-containing protein [Treponemataceae bacterium]|nr:HD domain-containing protein [Treponemataceae bacterium]
MSTTVGIEALRTSLIFKSDLMLDKNFVLLPVTVPVYQELLDLLKEWQFSEFECESGISLGGDIGVDKNAPDGRPHPKKKLVRRRKIKPAAGKSYDPAHLEQNRIASVSDTYNEMMEYIASVYRQYATHKKINQAELEERIKNLCVFIKENKRYVLRISPSAAVRSKNFLVAHSMRSTVLAITIGLELHMELSRLVELGMTCLLHEIGMLRIPPQLYMSDRPLSTSERTQISLHPILGCNIVKELEFPVSVQLGILEHHEKENGTGYPRHLTSEKISIYAKIIAIVCSFEAITAPREYKTERTTFDAMVEMLKNKDNQYDATVLKALLYSLSLYPIGAYVYLSNGKVGLVTDVSPDNPTNPIVQIVNETGDDGSPKTVQTDDGANKIARVLSKKESEDIRASLQNAEAGGTAADSDGEDEDEYEEYYEEEEDGAENSTSAYLDSVAKEKEIDAQFSEVDLSEFS